MAGNLLKVQLHKVPMRLLAFILFLIVQAMPSAAFALSSDWVRDGTASDDAVVARLVSGIDSTGNEKVIALGLDVDLGNDWHTYWRSPGEAGLPPQLDWSRSQTDDGNVGTAALLYPAPQRYTAYGLETVGYRHHVLFPIDVTVRKPGVALNAEVGVDLLVCSSICVPKHFDLKLTVPAGNEVAPPTPGADAPLIDAARAHLPGSADSSGLILGGVANNGQAMTFALTSRDSLTAPDIFIEDDDNIGFGAPDVKIDETGHSATLTVHPVDTLPLDRPLAGMKLTLTIANGDQAAEIRATVPPVAATAAPAPPAPPVKLSTALLFALIGGLILNLMPCVLPVLSLKILSVVSHGGGTRHKVRQSFLMTATGIVFSFLVLASATVGLKSFGLALGWGVQFQQPVFLVLLVLLLTFFAANLWDLFDIPLPRFLADRLDHAYHPKLAGDFATGAFATLLATPCSAPFLGTAVGFALAGGAGDIFMIFAVLGLGMALPYLLVALFPRAATLLPRPGAWMLRLRRLLGCALALTAMWLVWVLAAQITIGHAVTVGMVMAGIIILLVLCKRGMRRGLIAVGLVEFAAVALMLTLGGAAIPRDIPMADRQWLAFDQNALDADIAEGKTVFLDVTADWCLTCKANMKLTLSRDEVAHRLFHTDIVAMQADWTNPDPVIADLLHRYGRYGIPFNAVYGPGAPQGIVLPELLTPQKVLDALDKASQPTP
jgi:suppressor for copper-sensitivity B